MTPSNAVIAARLDDVADLLGEQRANPFRVQAWRRGAEAIRRLGQPVRALLRGQGLEGLDRLPAIGPALARAIRELVETGRLSTLDRLRGEIDPVSAIASVPGIGSTIAARIHDRLGIESLEQLEAAAHDGRLAGVEGLGPRRLEGVRNALATRLRSRRRGEVLPGPPVDELLDIDREYRERAARGDLPTIAPRRFNPTGERWLPVLHTTRGDRHYTALFSNTATAHRLGRTRDWVVVYLDGADGDHSCTVVTESRGVLGKRRVVRGRESECITHYHLDAFTHFVPLGSAVYG